MLFEKDKATYVLFACLSAMSTDSQLIPTYQTYFFPLSWEGQRSNALFWQLRLSPVSASWLCFIVDARKTTQLMNQLKKNKTLCWRSLTSGIYADYLLFH